MINEQIFRQWWYVFHGEDKLVELRLIGTINGRDITLSGYFTDYQTALQAVSQYGEGVNVFSPFNPIIEACSNRPQLNFFKKLGQKENSTSDNDIQSRRWIMIDFDPNRPAGTNSTNEEKEKAYLLMKRVGVFLRDQGFTSPIVAMSGNGYHCYYRVNLPNNSECRILCENFLHAIELMFGDETCDIDIAVANAARITKVIGSVAYKGRDTEERPCRLAHFVKIPDEIEPTPVEMVQKVAEMIPKKELPSRYNGYGESFDIDKFLSVHGIEVQSVKPYKDGGRKIILAHCPFNPDHKAPDSAIFVGRDGAIGFRCLHNSCANYTWRDVRIHFEPDAYSKRDRDAYERKRDYNSTTPRPAPVVLEEDDEKGKKWLAMKEIEWQDPSLLTYIPTEITEIDRETGGLALGDVTIISGLSGCVDCDTEFFNGYGWKRIADYAHGDKVLQYNADGSAELVYPEDYIKRPCESLSLIHTKYGVNQCVSDEHRIVYQTSKGNLAVKTFADMKAQHEGSKNGFSGKFYTTFNYSGSGIDLTDAEIRLMCAVIADGHFVKSYRNERVCRVNIKRKDKQQRLKQLLDESNSHYCIRQWNPRNPDFLNFVFIAPRREKHFSEYWYGCNKHQLEIVCDEVLRWDGDGERYFSTVKESADFVQFAFSACGIRARITEDNRQGQEYVTGGKMYIRKSDCYTVMVTHRTMLSIGNQHCLGGKATFPEYRTKDGYKYCFTVPSGMLVLRRNGCINITGNSGKSTMLNKFILSSIQHGYKCAIWSGELSPSRFKTWLNQVAAGANFLQKSIGATGKEYYYCPRNIAAKIDEWTDGKLFLYNNNYGNHSSQILQDVRNCVKEHGTQLLIFDNKMAMALDSWEGDKNEREAGLINELAQFAKVSQLHIILVCHPRKEQLNSLLRMQSIAGNSDLYNCASNVFLCHRVNRDFERCAKEFFGYSFLDEVLEKKYDEVVEVAKNRSDGPNVVTGMYYEKKTRRYLNDIAEYTIYGWQEDDMPSVVGQVEMNPNIEDWEKEEDLPE